MFIVNLAVLSGVLPSLALMEPDLADLSSLERFARLALGCIHREYPSKVAHVLRGDGDARPPRELTPVFFGCYDWHSAVHGHWMLARLCRLHPQAGFAAEARSALAASFKPERVAGEVRYLQTAGRETFERPYGLAWLLQLAAELREWDDPQAREWAAALEPLEMAAARSLKTWLPKLSAPVRTGEHSQTAFALGLAIDWARARGERDMEALFKQRALDFFSRDAGWKLSFEPGGEDFLSPGLAEADLLRRVLPQGEFAAWLRVFLPEIQAAAGGGWLRLETPADRKDGKLAHLDGLNLSRAWMLEGIIRALPENDPRLAALQAAAQDHRRAGLAAVTGEHYEGGHWLGTFAVYLATGRGL